MARRKCEERDTHVFLSITLTRQPSESVYASWWAALGLYRVASGVSRVNKERMASFGLASAR
jgi:hypothetical protein